MKEAGDVARLRSGVAVGAWLLKANPAVWDIGAFLSSGQAVDRWRLAPSYRVGLMAPGHPAALWVTRGDPGRPAGMWATGVVTGTARADVGEPDDPLWLDPAAQRQVRPYIEVRLEVLDEPVTADELRGDPRLAATEILRAPRMGSPLAFTTTEWEAINGLLDQPRQATPSEYPLRP